MYQAVQIGSELLQNKAVAAVMARCEQGKEVNDHLAGRCKPCAYFWQKTDGCRWGDSCEFCHRCDRDAIKRQKKTKKQWLRAMLASNESQAQKLEQRNNVGGKMQLNKDEPAHLLAIRPPPGLGLVDRPCFQAEVMRQMWWADSPMKVPIKIDSDLCTKPLLF